MEVKKGEVMTIAIIQTQIFDFEIEKNLENLTSICDTITESVDWIVFPEMFLTGFVTDTSLCEKSKKKGLDFMFSLAYKHRCAVEGSLLVEDKGLYYNRHYFITEDKQYYYDKQKLFSLSDEAKVLTRGEGSTIVEYEGWKINLKTCYDLRFADICKNTATPNKIQTIEDEANLQQYDFLYDILTFVASWPKSRSEQWKTLLKARAIENQCYVVAVNRQGADSANTLYSGDSCVIDMKGNQIDKLPNSTDNVFYYSINKETLDHGRNKFPVYKDW